MIITITAIPESVQAFWFIKESYLNLRVRAERIGSKIIIKKNDLVAAFKELSHGKKLVAQYYESLPDNAHIELKEGEYTEA